MRELTLGGLFEGIGGFPLAATLAGIKPVWSNEIDPYCCKVLRKNFTHEIIEKDIKQIKNLPYVDIVSGGFPCQPFSVAGKREGEGDDRALWPEMLRIICEVGPKWVVGENVAGILSMDDGKTFEGICNSLENEGYTVQAYNIPACGVGAWHRRERIWIIAHNDKWRRSNWSNPEGREGSQIEDRGFCVDVSNSDRNGNPAELDKGANRGEAKGGEGSSQQERETPDRERVLVEPFTGSENVSNPRRCGWNNGGKQTNISEWQIKSCEEIGQSLRAEITGCCEDATNSYRAGCEEFNPPGFSEKPGLNSRQAIEGREYWNAEPELGRVANGIPNRVDRLKGLGNAIVPQIAYEIFKAIITHETQPNQPPN